MTINVAHLVTAGTLGATVALQVYWVRLAPVEVPRRVAMMGMTFVTVWLVIGAALLVWEIDMHAWVAALLMAGAVATEVANFELLRRKWRLGDER
jgi:hypothetical protein